MLRFLERSLIYYPTRYPAGFWDTEALSAESGCAVEDCFFAAEDGVRLHAWWCQPPQAGRLSAITSMVLLLFHGNAGNLSDRAQLVVEMARRIPAQVMIVDYRGYGRSEGRPSEAGLYKDGAAAWRYLTVERGVAPERIILLGKSLGGAVAVHLAAEVEPGGLIAQSTFTSVRDMARHHFPFVPRVLVRTRMRSVETVHRVTCPKLHIHGTADEVVPYELGRRLFRAAPEPKVFFEVPEASHNTTIEVGGGRYFGEVGRFVESCARRRS